MTTGRPIVCRYCMGRGCPNCTGEPPDPDRLYATINTRSEYERRAVREAREFLEALVEDPAKPFKRLKIDEGTILIAFEAIEYGKQVARQERMAEEAQTEIPTNRWDYVDFPDKSDKETCDAAGKPGHRDKDHPESNGAARLREGGRDPERRVALPDLRTPAEAGQPEGSPGEEPTQIHRQETPHGIRYNPS